MDIKINYNPLVSIGYLSVDVPQDVMCEINQEVFELKNTSFSNAIPFNNRLYGAIEKEFKLVNCFNILEKFTTVVSKQYWQFTNKPELFHKKHSIEDVWVNFQNKYEFNPLHIHTKCDLSFVIWVRIPYNIKNEIALPSVAYSNDFQKQATSFVFVYPDGSNLNTRHIQVDESYQGKMIVFPSSLQHQVYPFFTSDDYRISVAGNIILED